MKNIFLVFCNMYKKNKMILLSALVISILAMGLCEISKDESAIKIVSVSMLNSSVGIVDEDNSFLSEQIGDYLQDDLNISVMYGDYDDLNKQLINYKISTIITIPKGFYDSLYGDDPLLLNLETLNDFENAIFIENDVNTYLSMVKSLIDASNEKGEVEKILLKPTKKIVFESNLLVEQKNFTAITLVNMLLLTLLGVISLYIPQNIYHDKSNKIYQRIQITNISPLSYVLGIALFGYLTVLITVVPLIIYLYLNSVAISIPLWLFSVLYLLYGSFTVGFGILIGIICKSKNVIGVVISSFYTIASMLGGAWFPVNDSADILAKIARFIPVYWTINVANTPNAYYTNIGIMILFNVFVYLCAITLFKVKEEL